MYSFVTEDMEETKKAKGVKSNVTKNLSLSDYKNSLYNKKVYHGNMYIFKSKLHTVYTSLINKISLSYLDNKRFICDNNVNTLARGNFALNNNNNEDNCQMNVNELEYVNKNYIDNFMDDDDWDDCLMEIEY